MKTEKYPGGNSKHGNESGPQDRRRKKKSSPMSKPQIRTPRGRKALKERKNTLKIPSNPLSASREAKLSLKGSSTDPEQMCSAAVARSGTTSKGILDKEKLKRLLSGVAQSKEVGKTTENTSEPMTGKHSSNDEVEKRTMQKENIMKPIIDKDKLKKILNGLFQEKDAGTQDTQTGLRPSPEAVAPVVNKDKLKTLLNKVYELQEGESEATTSSGVADVNSDLKSIAAKTSTVEAQGDKNVQSKLKRHRAAKFAGSLKRGKLEETCTLGFRDKLRRRGVQEVDVANRRKSALQPASATDRVKLKVLPTDDDDVILLGDKSQSKGKEPVKALTCNFDKQKLMRLLSGVPIVQDQTASTSMLISSESTSCAASDPKQLTDDSTPEGKLSDAQVTEAPFSLSNELLKSNVLTKSGDGITLRGIMIDRLNAARFRYINEQLYTSTGEDAQNFFTKDPEAFTVYHQGYQSQVNKWPISPLNIIIDDIARRKQPLVIADFGCGDARLAKSVPNKVHSFDLVALNEHVTACNMAKVPLKGTSVDVAVFCLSLMGTNLSEYLLEANRILKMGGILKIAEVESRFESVPEFIKQVGKLGFSLIKQDTCHKMFVLLDFAKMKYCTRKHLVNITLHPCLYKKRVATDLQSQATLSKFKEKSS